MLSANEIINFLTENKSFLRTNFSCIEIGLFGSFARNEQNTKSDIDILVVFEPGTPDLYAKELNLKEYLKKSLDREIDICAKKWLKPIFKTLVLEETIYA